MLRRLSLGLISCVGLAACSSPESPASSAAQTDSDWVTLFDGSGLSSWSQVGTANWSITGDTVEADASGPGFLLTNEIYDDFDLELEFWVSPDANSGVFIRCSDPAAIAQGTAYEVNIFDQRPDPKYRTGAIVEFAEPAVLLDTGDRWNTYAISARGDHLTVTLNGQQTVDLQNDRYASGPIALQYGAGTVKFRNIRIRNL